VIAVDENIFLTAETNTVNMHSLWIRKVDKFVPQIPVEFHRLCTGVDKIIRKMK
jgi:hypothetical protein